MGQYIQIGICTEFSLCRPEVLRAEVSDDEIEQATCQQSIDLSLFERAHSPEALRWKLRRPLVEDGLVAFLQSQWTLAQGAPAAEQQQLLARLSVVRAYDDILRVIEDEGSWMLQRDRHQVPLTIGRWRRRIRGEAAVLIYFTEGKALLECYTGLFRYIEKLIARQRAEHPLAAAVSAALQ